MKTNKKIAALAVLSASTLILQASQSMSTAPASVDDSLSITLGDANSDGKITVADAMCIANYLVTADEKGINLKAADMNSDEKIDYDDTELVIRKWLSMRTSGSACDADYIMSLADLLQEEDGKALFISHINGNIDVAPTAIIDSLYFSNDGNTLFIASSDTVVDMPMAEVKQCYFDEMPTSATIAYNADNVTTVNPYFLTGVKIEATDANVVVSNANTTTELTFALQGSTASGSFTYNGAYKTTISLDGVSITNPLGPAIDIQCGKRIALNLKKGTDNTLIDGSGDHKAALYCKGHLEIDKSGNLTVTGNAKHAIATKEYLQIKNGTGNITVLGAKGDGIHAGQYFQMNGGNVTISNVDGDGIQAEATSNAEDENNGQIMINGGTVTVNTTSDDSDAIQADSNITITDTKSTPVITISATGKGGKGIKTDGELVIGNSDTGTGPVLKISTTGARYTDSTDTGTNTGGNTTPGGWGGWGGRPGGGGPGGGGPGGSASTGSSSKAIKAQGAIAIYGGTSEITTAANGAEGIESKTSVTIAGGQHYLKCYDDCINSKGNITFDGGITVCYATNNDAVDSNAGRAGAITIGNGVVLAYTSAGSPEEGLDCDNNSYIRITGTGIAISAGGAQGGGGSSSSSITNAAQGYAFVTSSISYATGRYYTLSDSSGNNLITYAFDNKVSSTLSLFTATGMKKGSTYNVKYSTTAPTDANKAFHGVYLGSTATGTTSVASFTAK